MRKHSDSTTTYAADQETRGRDVRRMRSRRLVVALLAAVAVVAAGVGPAVGVGDVLDDGAETHTAFIFDRGTWGATWS